jgi:hypothetical protein
MPTLQVWKLRTFQRQLFVKDVVGQERGLKIIDVGIDIRHGDGNRRQITNTAVGLLLNQLSTSRW